LPAGLGNVGGDREMNRVDVIQSIINRKKRVRYLEIGVKSGKCFLLIKAKRKYAVDPSFNISLIKKVKWKIKNPSNIFVKYYEVRSDDYFAHENYSGGYDVVFLDGLHAYKQTLVDVDNSLSYLNEKGVIIVHDCNPPHEAAAYTADSYEHAASSNLPGWNRAWCGDVWKTVVYLRSFRKDLNVFVLDCDFGLGIITRGEPDDTLPFSVEELNQLTYRDLEKNKKELLNLKKADFFWEFLKGVH
jgi:hypothetical protein